MTKYENNRPEKAMQLLSCLEAISTDACRILQRIILPVVADH